MADAEVRITLRLPEELRDRLQAAADLGNRSMNGEIVGRLDWSLEGAPREIDSLHDLLEKATADRAGLRENERRLVATIADLSQARASLIEKNERLKEELRSVASIKEDQARLKVMHDEAIKDRDAALLSLEKAEQRAFDFSRRAAAAAAESGAYLEVIKHLTKIIADASGGDRETMAAIAESIRALGRRYVGENGEAEES